MGYNTFLLTYGLQDNQIQNLADFRYCHVTNVILFVLISISAILFSSKNYLYIYALLKVNKLTAIYIKNVISKAVTTGRNIHASDIQVNRCWNDSS